MKQINLKKLLPHVVAIIVFLILSIFLTKPTLDGKVLQQHDVVQSKAMLQQSLEFKEKNGYLPAWTNSMFSGMPAFQILFGPKHQTNISVGYVHYLLTLGLPKPINFLFLACLCFYILCIVLGINPWLSILGGVAYGFCSYNPIIITAGHDTKMLSMAYAPLVLASLQILFQKKYWLGSALLLTSGILFIYQNHQQIVYYTLLMALIMAVHFVYKCIKQKQIKDIFIAGGICLVMGAAMLGAVSILYWPTYELSQETMRGGRSELTPKNKDKKNETKGGLDKDYAFQYSYGKAEALTLIVPNAFGGGSSEGLGENSKAIQVLQENTSIPQEFSNQIAQASPMYWGELYSTSGAVYIGAGICLLFLLGAFFSKNEHKWWLVSVTILGIVLAWGKNFETVNYFLFDYMPFYKKFRAPSMALVMPQLSIVLLAVIFLNEFLLNSSEEKLKKLFKNCLYLTGAVALILISFYFFANFTNGATQDLKKNIANALQGKGGDFLNSYFAALKQDRQAFYLSDLFRSLGFMAVIIIVLFLYTKKILKLNLAIGILILTTIFDLVGVSKRYLKDENFIDASEYESNYVNTNADNQIKNDTGFYRVANLAFPSGNGYSISVNQSFNEALASYRHHTIGGYSPAKLGLYQDIIENQLYSNIDRWGKNGNKKDSFPVLNMLNTKYFIVPTNDGKQTQAIPNPYAMGNCWLVREIKLVKNADEEMASLNNFDPSKTAFVDERYKSTIPFMPVYDSLATIKLIENKNDAINYSFNANSNQFAVFSEVYYSNGWNAYIDGKLTPYCRTNYILRGLAIPAGKHSIEFKFEPTSIVYGEKISNWSNILSVFFVLFALFMAWKNKENLT